MTLGDYLYQNIGLIDNNSLGRFEFILNNNGNIRDKIDQCYNSSDDINFSFTIKYRLYAGLFWRFDKLDDTFIQKHFKPEEKIIIKELFDEVEVLKRNFKIDQFLL